MNRSKVASSFQQACMIPPHFADLMVSRWIPVSMSLTVDCAEGIQDFFLRKQLSYGKNSLHLKVGTTEK